MKREYLLDTNIATAFLAGNDLVRRRISTRTPEPLPHITAAELLYGAEKAGRPETIERISEFTSFSRILHPTSTTLVTYARTQAKMDKLGTRIPSNDLWIACLALDLNAIVVTDDEHFGKVPDLQVENWLLP